MHGNLRQFLAVLASLEHSKRKLHRRCCGHFRHATQVGDTALSFAIAEGHFIVFTCNYNTSRPNNRKQHKILNEVIEVNEEVRQKLLLVRLTNR